MSQIEAFKLSFVRFSFLSKLFLFVFSEFITRLKLFCYLQKSLVVLKYTRGFTELKDQAQRHLPLDTFQEHEAQRCRSQSF